MRFLLSSLILLIASVCPVFAKYEAQQDICVKVDVGAGTGSGVIVTREIEPNVTRSFVWTAAHVVDALQNADGTFRNATIYYEWRHRGIVSGVCQIEARVIAYSHPERGHDLALLEIPHNNFKPVGSSATFDLSGDALEVGTEVLHVGAPSGLFNSCSLGIMSQTDRDILKNGITFDQTTVMGFPGSSGGAVFNLKTGEVVGLLVRGVGPGLNFIVPNRRIIKFAEDTDLRWAIDPTSPMPSIEELGAQVRHDGTLTIRQPRARARSIRARGGNIIKLLIGS